MRILQWLLDIVSTAGASPQYEVMLELPIDEDELATHTTQSMTSILASSGLLSRDKTRLLKLMREARKARKAQELDHN